MIPLNLLAVFFLAINWMFGPVKKMKKIREMRTMSDKKVEPGLIPVTILDVGSSRNAGGLIEVEEKTTRSCHGVSDSPHSK